MVLKYFRIFLLGLMCLLVSQNCRRTLDENSVLDAGEGLTIVLDTLYPDIYTVPAESFYSYNPLVNWVGMIYDNDLGDTTTGALYASFLPSSAPVSGGIVDSVILTFGYKSMEGVAGTRLELEVGMLEAGALDYYEAYKTDEDFTLRSSPKTDITVTVNSAVDESFYDTSGAAIYDTTHIRQLVRVYLDNEFGQAFLAASANSTDLIEFTNELGGIYIKPTRALTAGAMFQIKGNTSITTSYNTITQDAYGRSYFGQVATILQQFSEITAYSSLYLPSITVYYHTAEVADTLVRYVMTNNAQKISHYTHSSNTNTPHTKSLGGMKARLKVSLADLLNTAQRDSIRMSNAWLYIHAPRSDIDSLFPAPQTLRIREYIDDTAYMLPDEINNQSAFGGYAYLTDENNDFVTYRYSLANTIQQHILSNTDSIILELSPVYLDIARRIYTPEQYLFRRAIIHTNDVALRPRLEYSYVGF